MYSKISALIDELSSQYLGVWQDVCNIESPTSSKGGVDKVGQYFIDLAKTMGFATEVCPQEVAGDAICMTMNPEATGKSVAFSAHMDTVHPIGSFGYPPVKIEGDYIYGPGVVDCKGGAVASLLAMAAMQKAGFGGKVMLILQSDEEVGSSISQHKTIHYMCEKAKDCVAFFNCEGEKTDQKDVLVLYRKGILRYTFEVKGIAAHASKCFKKGKSAILEAAHKIIALEKVKEPDGLTFCCGKIQGGSADNTVPETCSFTVDIRYATAEDRARAIEMVERVANTSYTGETTCTLTKASERIAMEMADRNVALLNKINAIYARLGMLTYNIGGSLGGSDAAYTTSAGIPTIDSIGVKGYAIHTLQERGYIPSLVTSAKRLAMAAYGLITE